MDSRTREAMNKAVSKSVDAVDAKQTEQIEALENRIAGLEKGIKKLTAEIATLGEQMAKDETKAKNLARKVAGKEDK